MSDGKLPDILESGGPQAGSVRAMASSAVAAIPTVAPKPLEEVIGTFMKWLYLEDLVPLLVVLATAAANLYLEGDPVWILLVGASGGGKTEIVRALSALPGVLQAATLTEASLLSGTPAKEHSKIARGGLLRHIGDRGLIVFKDFTSILSQNKDARAQVIAALREIFDGSWTRHVGTDGGKSLSWTGHVGVVAGCTPTIDRYHGVIASLGERFLMLRISPSGRRELARRALDHKGREGAMRVELSEAVAGLFAGLNAAQLPISEAEREMLIGIADFAARARSSVERDGASREIELIPAPEAPTRIAVTLARLRDGLLAIGVAPEVAMRIVSRVALDSIPALRRSALEALLGSSGSLETADLATALGYPTGTVRRALEDLCGHGLVERASRGRGKSDSWLLHQEIREEMATFPDKSSYTGKEIIEAVATPAVLVPAQTASAHSDFSGTPELADVAASSDALVFVDGLVSGAP
jgi:hypothetical protein